MTVLFWFIQVVPVGSPDGFELEPRLPSDWKELTADRVRFQNHTLLIRAKSDSIEIRKEGVASEPLFLQLPKGNWKTVWLRDDGSILKSITPRKRESDGACELSWGKAAGVRFELQAEMPPLKSPTRP